MHLRGNYPEILLDETESVCLVSLGGGGGLDVCVCVFVCFLVERYSMPPQYSCALLQHVQAQLSPAIDLGVAMAIILVVMLPLSLCIITFFFFGQRAGLLQALFSDAQEFCKVSLNPI